MECLIFTLGFLAVFVRRRNVVENGGFFGVSAPAEGRAQQVADRVEFCFVTEHAPGIGPGRREKPGHRHNRFRPGRAQTYLM